MSKQTERTRASNIKVFCSYDKIVNIGELVPNPKNPNKHPDKQIELLADIIEAQGWRSPITVSKLSGFIVKGHGRLEASEVLGVKEVPVEYQHYNNEAEEYADMIADNRLSELSNLDRDSISAILDDVDFSKFNLDLTGFDEDAIALLQGSEIDLEDFFNEDEDDNNNNGDELFIYNNDNEAVVSADDKKALVNFILAQNEGYYTAPGQAE